MSASPPLVPGPVRRSTELRAFLIQGSWNYRVMQGTGVAFAMLPVLRHVWGEGPGFDEALARHCEHFNAHPYLSSVALGALTRLEAEHVDEATIRRFRAAIRGPLGALGDRVVWATWLPLAAVVALLLYWVGVPGWIPALTFVLFYNAVHLTMRLRGFRLGFDAGTGVGVRLRAMELTNRAERLSGVLLLLVGALVGLLIAGTPGAGVLGWPWQVALGLAFGVGLLGGVRLWRPTALVVVGAVVLLFLFGLRTG